jgi:hypothetical protein
MYILGVIFMLLGIIRVDNPGDKLVEDISAGIFFAAMGYFTENQAMDLYNFNHKRYSIHQENMYQFIQLMVGGVSGGLLANSDKYNPGAISGGVSSGIGAIGTVVEYILDN